VIGRPYTSASFLGNRGVAAATLATPSRSTTIAVTSDETRLVVVNREANSLSIIQVKDAQGNDVAVKLDEIAVGLEPRCVSVHPNDQVAYVTNGISATVSVVDLVLGRVVRNVPTGTEPRGCALTPNGHLLYVANNTEGTVSIFFTGNPLNPIPVGAVPVGRNPTAVAITNDGDDDDADETVFVTQIFAELNPDFVDPNFVPPGMIDPCPHTILRRRPCEVQGTRGRTGRLVKFVQGLKKDIVE